MVRLGLGLALLLALAIPLDSQVLTRPQEGQPIRCTITSTATTSTVVTGCSAPGAAVSIYISSLQWSSSIISTTANFMRIQSGTGGTCGTATTVLHDSYALAFTTVPIVFEQPIKLTANHELCFIHAAAGTRLVNIQGYIAP